MKLERYEKDKSAGGIPDASGKDKSAGSMADAFEKDKSAGSMADAFEKDKSAGNIMDDLGKDSSIAAILDNYEILTPLDPKNKVFMVKNLASNEILAMKNTVVTDWTLYSILKKQRIKGVPEVYELAMEEEHELTIIEEYIHGNNLEQLISRKGVLAEEQVVKYMIALCDILKNFHEMSPAVIHRDIKPSNIILSRDGVIYLIDFNIARTYKEKEKLDTVALVSNHFSAPELYGFGQSDQRSDIYSIGATCIYLLTGGFLNDADYHGILEKIINKSTMMSPKDRYQSIAELEEDFRECEIFLDKKSASANQAECPKASFMIPGFRTKKWWKMLLAIAGYILIAELCFTMKVKSLLAPPFDVVDLWIERISIFLFFIVSLFLICNYRDCHKLLAFRGKKKLSYLGILLGIIIVFAITMLFIVFEVNILQFAGG